MSGLRLGTACLVILACIAGVAVLLMPMGGIEVAWSGRSGIMTRHAGILRYAWVDGMVGAEGISTDWHVDRVRLGLTLALVQGCWGMGVAAVWWTWRGSTKRPGRAPVAGTG
jgi:hypothetical protein